MKIAKALQKYGAAIDRSDLGTGKTYVACYVAKLLNYRPVIVCPLSVISSWEEVLELFGISKYFVSNYEKYRVGKHSKICELVKKQAQSVDRRIYKYWKWKLDDRHLLIWDEAHRLKGASNTRSMALAANDRGLRQLYLSATIGDNPMHFKAIGEATKIFTRKGFQGWMLNNGVRPCGYEGKLEFAPTPYEENDILVNLHKTLDERGGRIDKMETRHFPENIINAVPVNLNDANTKRIKAIYKELEERLQEVKLQITDKQERARNILAVMTYSRQLIELEKVSIFVELTNDALENSNSVVVFLNYRETIRRFQEAMKEKTGLIIGDQDSEQRNRNIDLFQTDKIRVIAATYQAGGVGISLHDINGKYPRFSILSPTWSAQDLLQATGRIHRAGAKSPAYQRIVFAAKTVESDVALRVQSKITRINTINDGDLLAIKKELTECD